MNDAAEQVRWAAESVGETSRPYGQTVRLWHDCWPTLKLFTTMTTANCHSLNLGVLAGDYSSRKVAKPQRGLWLKVRQQVRLEQVARHQPTPFSVAPRSPSDGERAQVFGVSPTATTIRRSAPRPVQVHRRYSNGLRFRLGWIFRLYFCSKGEHVVAVPDERSREQISNRTNL